jgi:hypothetical protein
VETSRSSRIYEVQEVNTDLRLRQFEKQVVRQVLAAKEEKSNKFRLDRMLLIDK